jgi:hypothetical protein
MVFGSIAAHNQNTITVLNIIPVVGHRTASERLSQSRNSCAVSDTGLMFEVYDTLGAHECVHCVTFFVVQRGGAEGGNTHVTVDDLALFVLHLEGLVAGILGKLGDAFLAPFPAFLVLRRFVWNS